MQAVNFHDAQYNQMLRQEQLLPQADRTCQSNNLSRPRVNLNTLNLPTIQRIAAGTRYNFYDYQFLQWLACSVRYTFVAARSTTGLAEADAVQNFIQQLTRIGSASGAGIVWQPTFGGMPNVILLKTPKTLALDVGIFHEFFIGTLFTNQLRRHVPNFMFVYGLFKCSAPKFDEVPRFPLGYVDTWPQNKPKVIAKSFCDSTRIRDVYDILPEDEINELENKEVEIERLRRLGHHDQADNLERELDEIYSNYETALDNPVNYLIIENIPGGLAMTDHLKLNTTTFEDLLSYLLQLSIALDWGLKLYDFTHYDLHTDNIIMRSIELVGQDSFVEMSFAGEAVKRKIYTRYIPTIIDYGRSHVRYTDPVSKKEEHFGFYLSPTHIAYNQSRPIFDLYKLVGFIVYEVFTSYRDRLPEEVDYSNASSEFENMSTSSESNPLSKTIPMSISSFAIASSTLKDQRSMSEIEDELEAVSLLRKIPAAVFEQMLSLLVFFPFVREMFFDYQRRNISRNEIVLFVLREFLLHRFSIGNRWTEADQEPLKSQLYHNFYDYVLGLQA